MQPLEKFLTTPTRSKTQYLFIHVLILLYTWGNKFIWKYSVFRNLITLPFAIRSTCLEKKGTALIKIFHALFMPARNTLCTLYKDISPPSTMRNLGKPRWDKFCPSFHVKTHPLANVMFRAHSLPRSTIYLIDPTITLTSSEEEKIERWW